MFKILTTVLVCGLVAFAAGTIEGYWLAQSLLFMAGFQFACVCLMEA